MSKITLNGFVLLLLLFLGNSSGNYASATAAATKAQFEQTTPENQPALVLTKAGPARFKK